jgi:hypothetical protein
MGNYQLDAQTKLGLDYEVKIGKYRACLKESGASH